MGIRRNYFEPHTNIPLITYYVCIAKIKTTQGNSSFLFRFANMIHEVLVAVGWLSWTNCCPCPEGSDLAFASPSDSLLHHLGLSRSLSLWDTRINEGWYFS